MKGVFQGILDFWYDPDGLANILWLAKLCEVGRVVFDSSDGDAFIAHLPDWRVWAFTKSENGLYFYDTAADPNFSSGNVIDYCFVTTVANNMKRYHRREVDKAKKAGDVYATIGKPSRQQFYDILNNGWLINCPVTVEDARRYFDIYGNDVATLRGKTSKQKGSAASSRVPSSLPPNLLTNHSNVKLFIDMFYVQGIHSISRKIQFRTASQLI